MAAAVHQEQLTLRDVHYQAGDFFDVAVFDPERQGKGKGRDGSGLAVTAAHD